MAIYRIVERRLDGRQAKHGTKIYCVQRKFLFFWVNILGGYKSFFFSKEEALDAINKLLSPKQKKNTVVWTNEPQPKMDY